jgi:hypothetical protein
VPLVRRLEAWPFERRLWRQAHFAARWLKLSERRAPWAAVAMLPDYFAYTWGVPTRRAAARDGIRRGWRELRMRTVRPARRTLRRVRGLQPPA